MHCSSICTERSLPPNYKDTIMVFISQLSFGVIIHLLIVVLSENIFYVQVSILPFLICNLLTVTYLLVATVITKLSIQNYFFHFITIFIFIHYK